jgi:inorganic pyrophosphatase
MNLWRELPSGPDWPHVINVIVEIPRGSRNKYEYDRSGAFMKLNRVLFSSLHYPGDYGFIPRTLKASGDPLAVLVMTNEPTFSGCVIQARPLGVFRLIDKGEYDDKILAVPHTDPLFSEYRDLGDVPKHFLEEAAHFFRVYKDLEMAEVEAKGWDDQDGAYDEIRKAVDRYWEHVQGRRQTSP